MNPQTDRSHYDESYYERRRLYSVAVQAEVLWSLRPASVIEVGPGRGVFAALFRQLSGARVVTMDIDPSLKPGVIGSVFEMPFADGAFDAAACRSEEHTSELQSQFHLVCRLLLEKK